MNSSAIAVVVIAVGVCLPIGAVSEVTLPILIIMIIWKALSPVMLLANGFFEKNLEKSIIQDLFMSHSKTERITKPQEDGEYVLHYQGLYDSCKLAKKCDKLIGTVQEAPDNQFIFSDSFKWTNIQIQNNGTSKTQSDKL